MIARNWKKDDHAGYRDVAADSNTRDDFAIGPKNAGFKT